MQLFDFINSICYKKDYSTVMNMNEDDWKNWSSFIILRILGNDPRLTTIVNYLSFYQGVISKKDMYKLLYELIPTNRYNLTSIKEDKEDKELLNTCLDYFTVIYNCSKKEAKEYFELLTPDSFKYIMESSNVEDKLIDKAIKQIYG